MKHIAAVVALVALVPLAVAEGVEPSVRSGRLAENLYELTVSLDRPLVTKILALGGPDGALLVDTALAENAPAIRQALDALDLGNVTWVVNTHLHDDHIGGNAALGSRATVIAHEGVRRRLTSGLGRLVRREPGSLPGITFGDTLTVFVNGEEVRLKHRPAGHSDTDITVHFVRAGVVAIGDMVIPDRFPYVDVGNGGNLAGLLQNLRDLAREYPQGTVFVSSHGPAYSAAQIAAYADTLAAMQQKVRTGLAAGQTAEQLRAAKVLADWSSWGFGYISQDWFINILVAAEQPQPISPLPSVLERLVPVLVTGRGEDAVALYSRLKAEQPAACTFAEADLNQLGYALLAQQRAGDAVEIFRLNVAEHPDSFNAHDSLGEGYMDSGQRELAIESYKMSLKLNPANSNAVEMLKRLR